MPALQAFKGDSAADLASRVPFSAKTDIDVLHTAYIESDQPLKREPVEEVTNEDPAWGLHETVTQVDSRDAATPDKWVPRHPRLVRLTGRHPFNCEPPLPDLMERGFITPTSLRESAHLSWCRITNSTVLASSSCSSCQSLKLIAIYHWLQSMSEITALFQSWSGIHTKSASLAWLTSL